MPDGLLSRHLPLTALFHGADAEFFGNSTTPISGISSDSRNITEGCLFAALKGTTADGTRFIPEAVTAGAAAVLAGSDYHGEPGVPVVRCNDPRRALAIAAARLFGRQPETAVAVTGTNGKTSVTAFLRQIWATAGHRAASLGTIGLIGPDGRSEGGLTTPDPVSLHRLLAGMADDNITHVAIEASSHGIDQRRLDGVRWRAAAFTNLSRDHLDYHPDVEAYRAAKLRLFDTLLPSSATVVIDADETECATVAAIADARNLRLLSVGQRGRTIRLRSQARLEGGMRLDLEAEGRSFDIALPLVGQFQISNALVAAALASATGVAMAEALAALEKLEGAPGRLEHVGRHKSGAAIFVDYAHTPDALANALRALRPHTGGRLSVVFGAGGDRDPGKRPLMGEMAAALADRVIVTDDNPRGEAPERIRSAILAGAPGAIEIGDRRQAIRSAVAALAAGDILLVAGKGHETGQIVGDVVLPFSDQNEVRDALSDQEDAA